MGNKPKSATGRPRGLHRVRPAWVALGTAVFFVGLADGAHQLTGAGLSQVRVGAERGRTAHSQTIEMVAEWRSAEGMTTTRTSVVTVLGTGLFHACDGQWLPSREAFELTPTAAVARQGAHQASLPLEAGTNALFTLDTDDGRRFRWRVRGLEYYDPETGHRVRIAEPQPSRAELIAPNRIQYRDAFGAVEADLLFENTCASFAQDIVLRSQLPHPTRWGLTPDRTRLEIVTEFVEAPDPMLERTVVWQEPDAARAARMVEPQLTHDRLGFGTYRFGPGTVLWFDPAATDPVPPPLPAPPILHRWERNGSSAYLFEHVEFAALEPLLDRLPPPSSPEPARGLDARLRAIPLAAAFQPASPADDFGADARADTGTSAALARSSGQAARLPGLILDWTLANGGQRDLTFRGDSTYVVAGVVNLEGTTTLEGGTVIKYTNNGLARINILGSLACSTAPYRPAVLTAIADDSVGDPMPHGPPSDYYASVALQMPPTGGTVSHLRIARARTALFFPPAASGTPVDRVRHVQVVDCLNGIEDAGLQYYNSAYWRTLQMGNVLFGRQADIPGPSTAVRGSYFRATIEYATVDRWSFLAQATGVKPATLAVRNSVFARVGRTADSPGVSLGQSAGNGFYASAPFGQAALAADTDPFVAVAGGSHYLRAGGPFFDRGVAPLDAGLARELAARTCDPPLVREQPCALDVVLGPTARRDSDRPDLGYHYPPLDHCWTALALAGTNGPATLLLTNGAALGIFGPRGTVLHQGGRFYSQGSPTNLNRIVRCETVQEDPTGPAPTAEPVLFASAAQVPDRPQIHLRFTEVVVLPGQRAWFENPPGFAPLDLTLRDCQIYAAQLTLTVGSPPGGPRPMTLALTNNLCRRVDLVLSQNVPPDQPRLEVHLRNNLFQGGRIELADRAGTGTWTAHENLFDSVSPLRAEGVRNSHNAYSGPVPLDGTLGGDLLDVVPDYRAGTLGNTYYPATGTQLARLIGAGSRPPAEAGLHHYTVKASNAKDGAELPLVVDIGFHYVACLSGQPFDTDGDGLPDWLEDANGNGAGTDDPSDWTRRDSVGDGLSDRERLERARNALVNDPAQDYAREQNTQWQPSVAVLDRAVVAVYWDSNRGLYSLASIGTNLCRMVASSLSIDGGQTFADLDVPPVNANPSEGDAGDPVLAVNRVAQTLYFAATSEHGTGAFKGVPLWKSTDRGRSFFRCPLVHPDITGSDYPWLAVDDYPGPGQHDLYLVVSGLRSGPTGPEAVRRQWLTVSPGGDGVRWTDIVALGQPNSSVMPQMVVGADHVAYVAWLERGPTNALQICAVANRGTQPGPVRTVRVLATPRTPMRLLRHSRTTDPEDSFKAFNYPALAVNPNTARSNHLYIAYADLGAAGGDRADVFFVHSTNGGVTWSPLPVRLNLDTTSNDQWMPALAVKPDGSRLFAGWLDRRADSDNGRIDVFGRWATVDPDGTIRFAATDFRITTESFPPAFAGTLAENTLPGHYDPVWPPGDVNLHWHYPWWEDESDPFSPTTADSYIHEIGEHNGACADAAYVYMAWSDTRTSSQATRDPTRRQADIRLARLPWPAP